MLYTIGHKESYDKGIDKWLESNELFLKRGRDESYGGGIAFLTKEEAESYIKSRCLIGYAVYGLLTTPSNVVFEHGINHIKETCQIVPANTRAVDDSNEAKLALALFRKFVMRNVTQWSMGSGHQHPIWIYVAKTLGENLNQLDFNFGPAWRFTDPENRLTWDQCCKEWSEGKST